jgi:hypothetical protein
MLAAAARRGGSPNERAPARRAIRVAGSPYRTPGVVLDYILVSGSDSYDFLAYNGANNTYWLQGDGYFSGTLTFEAGCVVKCSPNAYLLTYGSVACYGTQASPSLLTSQGDFVYGEDLGGLRAQDANPALWLYYIASPQTIQWVTVRYALKALEMDASVCGAPTHTVANCSFFSCQTGIGAYNCSASIQSSTCCQVSTPTASYVQGCGSFTGSFTSANPPTITTSPSSQCQFVLPTYSVGFNAVAAPYPCAYTWLLNNRVVGRSQSVTLTPTQLGTSYGGQKVWVYPTDAVGTGNPAGGWVGIVDSSAMAVARHWATYTNNKTCNLWSSRPTTDPPTGLAWDSSCLLYGKTGFTAISQCNQFAPRGQMPVTALTPRHGYMRGHGAGTPDNVPFAGLNSGFNGSNVYFCTGDGNNTLVTATVASGYTRCWGPDGYDWTILVFNADLPSTIQPMAVSYTWPTSYSVIFNTTQGYSQHGYMSANAPPFPPGSPYWDPGADPDAFPPFDTYPTYRAGDSGSPVILPETDDVLVFLGGDTTSSPCSQMQADMNTLSTNVNCYPYQMANHWVQ